MTLRARELSWRVGRHLIVDGVTLEAAPGEFLGLVGPNGSGKTTLLTMLAALRAPSAGGVTLDGAPLASFGRRNLARRVALVEQQADTTERLTARQAVELGRTPHLDPFSPWSTKDDAVVTRCLAAVDMADRAAQPWQTLSGGERQRLHIARALAQEPRYLLLDEPINHLDVEHQFGLLALVRDQPMTVVAALHDLNHAAMFCDRIAVMRAGRLVALGAPAAVLTRALLAEVFRVDAHVALDADGVPLIRYARPGSARASSNGDGMRCTA